MKKIGMIVLVIIVLVIVSFGLMRQYKSRIVRKTEPTKDVVGTRYTSADMPISFTIPKTYTSEVKNYLVILHPKDNDEAIFIERIATNFDDVDSYLDDLAEMNKMNVVARDKIEIHGLNFLLVQYIDMQVKKRIYITVRDGWAYTIDSSSPVLNDDLDAVAQSLEFSQ